MFCLHILYQFLFDAKFIRWKTTMNRVFERNFLELRWKHQNLKIVVWRVEGSDFLKTKDYTIDFESCAMIFGAIDVDDVICE